MTATKTPPIPTSELRARCALALRAIDDIRAILFDHGAPSSDEELAARTARAHEILDEIEALVPLGPPLSREERDRIERDAEEMPSREEMRAMFRKVQALLDDPETPDDFRAAIPRDQLEKALESMDEVDVIAPVEDAMRRLKEDLEFPLFALREAAARRGLHVAVAKLRS